MEGVNRKVIAAVKEFLIKAWRIRSIHVSMNRDRREAPWDHSYGVPSVQ